MAMSSPALLPAHCMTFSACSGAKARQTQLPGSSTVPLRVNQMLAYHGDWTAMWSERIATKRVWIFLMEGESDEKTRQQNCIKR